LRIFEQERTEVTEEMSFSSLFSLFAPVQNPSPPQLRIAICGLVIAAKRRTRQSAATRNRQNQTMDYTDYTDDLIAELGVGNAEFFPSVQSPDSASGW
jgi:hypothetical protein